MSTKKLVPNDQAFRLALKIQQLLEAVDNRCAAVDGPVTPANREITAQELRTVYVTALKIKAVCA